MEFASFFNSIGTQVTVIEMLPKILGPMDAQLSAMLQAQYEKKGVTFHLSCKVVAVEGNEVVYQTPEGETCRVQGDKILVSVGRRARLQGIGLENIGVELALNPAGKPYGIKVDAQMRTSVPGVYAAGDVTGFSMLAHTASREGEVAVNTIRGIVDEMHYNAVPGVVYTNPEVAGVGALEGARVATLPMAFSGRFVAENERGEGVCKVWCAHVGQSGIGAHPWCSTGHRAAHERRTAGAGDFPASHCLRNLEGNRGPGLAQAYDGIGMLGNSLAVRDEQKGFLPVITAVEVLQQPFFRFRIQGRRTLVQDEHAAGTQQGAGNGNALGLAFAEAAAYLTAGRVQSFGEVPDKLGHGGVQGLPEVFLRSLRCSELEIGADGTAEEGISLRNVHEIASEGAAGWNIVNGDLSLGGF